MLEGLRIPHSWRYVEAEGRAGGLRNRAVRWEGKASGLLYVVAYSDELGSLQ